MVKDQEAIQVGKIEYRCVNLFTNQFEWFTFASTTEPFGFIVCPNRKCTRKVGIYAHEGQRCNTCFEKITPAF
jgi:hypothetical protein